MTNLLATIFVTVMTTTNDIPRWTPQTCRDGDAEWVMYVDESTPGVPLLDWQTGKTNAEGESRAASARTLHPLVGSLDGDK